MNPVKCIYCGMDIYKVYYQGKILFCEVWIEKPKEAPQERWFTPHNCRVKLIERAQ